MGSVKEEIEAFIGRAESDSPKKRTQQGARIDAVTVEDIMENKK